MGRQELSHVLWHFPFFHLNSLQGQGGQKKLKGNKIIFEKSSIQ
jgi:hypothetical protein